MGPRRICASRALGAAWKYPSIETRMILLIGRDPLLLPAVQRAARPDEAVVWEPRWVDEALVRGWPRALVCDDRRGVVPQGRSEVPVVYVAPDRIRSWDRARRRHEVPPERIPFAGDRIAAMLAQASPPGTWVDRLLGDLGRLAGGPLPLPFRAFARHTLELPSRYTDLRDLTRTTGLSRGALKARFRRRDLDSPFTYLRWFRVMAVAEVLSDPSVTVAAAADRLGFTSGTNMCRMVRVLTGATPGALRDPGARRWLRVAFARDHLTRQALGGWVRLEDVFGRRVA